MTFANIIFLYQLRYVILHLNFRAQKAANVCFEMCELHHNCHMREVSLGGLGRGHPLHGRHGRSLSLLQVHRRRRRRRRGLSPRRLLHAAPTSGPRCLISGIGCGAVRGGPLLLRSVAVGGVGRHGDDGGGQLSANLSRNSE